MRALLPRRARLRAVSLLPVLTTLGTAPVPVALHSAAADLGEPTPVMVWTLVAFNLTLAIGTPPAGRLADSLGPPRLMRAGAATLLVGSVMAVAAPGFVWLVVARAVQGAGTAAVAGAAFTVVARLPSRFARLRTLGLLTACVTALFGAGPLLGSTVEALGGWRAVFGLSAIAAALGFAVAAALPTETGRESVYDRVAGALLAATSTAILLLLQSPVLGLPLWAVLACAVVAAGGGLLVARRSELLAPRFDLSRVEGLGYGVAGTLLGAANLGMAFLAPLLVAHLQPGWGVVQQGTVLAFGTAVPLAVAFLLSARLPRLPPARALGLLGVLSGGLMLGGGLSASVAGAVLASGGATAGFAGAQIVLLARVPEVVRPEDVGAATGVVSMLIVFGGAVGSAAAALFLHLADVVTASALLAVLPGAAVLALASLPRRGARTAWPPTARNSSASRLS